jgi:hypothetical protein
MKEEDNIFRDAAIINGICKNISSLPRAKELAIELTQEDFDKILEQLKKNDLITGIGVWGNKDDLYTNNPKFRLFGIEFNFKIV